MEKSVIKPVIFIHNDPVVFGSDNFFETLTGFVDGLPIDIYVYEATEYFKVKKLVKKYKEKDIDVTLIYDRNEHIYDGLYAYKNKYTTVWENGFSPLKPTDAFKLIIREAANNFRDADCDDCVESLTKIYKEVFGETLF